MTFRTKCTYINRIFGKSNTGFMFFMPIICNFPYQTLTW